MIPPKKPILHSEESHKNAPVLEDGAVQYLETTKIISNPNQPRVYFASEALEELALSIKKHGIIQPLVVAPTEGGKYEIIAGERRYRAAKLNGLQFLPVVVRRVKEHEKLELALIENLQRQDLNPIEEASGYRRLMDEFNLTQEDVSERVSKSRPVVANMLRLLNLPQEIREAIIRGKIAASSGRILAGISDAKKQKELFKKMLEGMPVRESEEHVRVKGMSLHTRRQIRDPYLYETAEKLREALGTKVDIRRSGKTGKIVIEFYSDEELKKIMKLLKC